MRAIVCLFLAGCTAIGPEAEAPANETASKPKQTPTKTKTKVLPEGFSVKGDPVVEAPFLEPAASWRHLRARLATAQSDARRRGADVLVGFEPRAVHLTTRAGQRTVWRLPDGLDLSVYAAYVVIRKDLTLTVFRADGTQVPPAEEVTVATARWGGDQPEPTEFRLVIKGSKAFRSMSSE